MNGGEVEKVVISVTPDTVKPKETVRRKSTGKLDTKTSPSLSSSDDKLPPHYLRASTSSCHEHCKYGTKHVFDVKKRNPNFRRYSANNDIQREEQDKAKISTLRVGRKSTNLELKTTHPKDESPDIPEVVKQEVQKDNLLSDTNKNLEEESYEESESIKLLAPSSFHESKMSLDHRHVSEGEGLFDTLQNLEEESYEESDNIKQTTLSPFHESIASLEGKPSSESEGLSGRPIGIRTVNLSPRHQLDMPDDLEAIELETPSPIEKNIISHVPTPLTWSEGSSDGSVSMESEIQSPTHAPLNPVEEISEASIGVEVVTPVEINESADEPHIITASAPKVLKPKTSLTTRKSVASAKLTPTGRAEKTNEGASSVKLKGSSSNHQSSAGNKKQTGMKSLKTVEGKRREAMKLNTDLSRVKTEVSDRDEASMEKKNEATVKPDVINKSNPAEKTKTPVNPKSAEAKIPSPVQGPITSTSPRVINKKVLSAVKSTEVPARFSLSPKLKTPLAKSTSAIVSSPINIKKNGSSPLKRMDAPAGSSTALKLKNSTAKSTPALISSERLPIQRSQGDKMIGSRYQSEPTHEKVLKPSRVSLSPKTTASEVSSMKSTKYRSSTLSTPLESRAKMGKLECKVKEPKLVKTVAKAIKTPKKNIRRSSSTTFSLTSSSSSSSSVSSHGKEEHDNDECTPTGENDPVFNGKETKKKTPVKSLQSSDKQRSRRTTTVHTGDKQPSSHMLNFRRGKVVSPKAESNAPRKLRFRPRVVIDNENGKEVLKRSFRIRRRASIGSVTDLITHKSEASSVVPRRLGVQEKKEARGLLNRTDDKHISPHKLNFLRGKVVSPKSENNGPKKLRFRARVANENPSGKEVSRRVFRRRGSIGSVTDLVTPSSDAPPVVLRHQDVQEKKEAQGLFNHVIEETASKLVEARKSKVKALVGAFETVISLQESRTTPTAKASVPC
ncbi:putative serine-rich protein-like [Iris pallida]|uniref:Serine-rich protein-like n=1 Tax=Iris pallida TaxID=29817 RepID=A0AAX6HSM6_IRIPA|nr:putative serine-rich protein-like [Iris pallida]